MPLQAFVPKVCNLREELGGQLQDLRAVWTRYRVAFY